MITGRKIASGNSGTGLTRDRNRPLIAPLQITAGHRVERRFYEQHPPRAEYALTDVGNGLRPVLKALFEWGQCHTKYRADHLGS